MWLRIDAIMSGHGHGMYMYPFLRDEVDHVLRHTSGSSRLERTRRQMSHTAPLVLWLCGRESIALPSS